MEEKILTDIEKELSKRLKIEKHLVGNRKVYEYKETGLLFEIVFGYGLFRENNQIKSKSIELKIKKCDSEDILYFTQIGYYDESGKEKFEITIDFDEVVNKIKL